MMEKMKDNSRQEKEYQVFLRKDLCPFTKHLSRQKRQELEKLGKIELSASRYHPSYSQV